MKKDVPDKEPVVSKSTLFDGVWKALMALSCWLIINMHNDVKNLMVEVLPKIRQDINGLEMRLSIQQFKAIPPVYPAKHEDPITLDSLTQK